MAIKSYFQTFFLHQQKTYTQETKLQLMLEQVIWKGYKLEEEQDIKKRERY